jgi:hypothetical protein
MKDAIRYAFMCACLLLVTASGVGQERSSPMKRASEEDYYKILRYEIPKDEVLETGAIESLPDGRIALGTRRGEIWIMEKGLTDDPRQARFTRFAHGLHEVLGLAAGKDGWLYVTQRGDVSRIKDTNSDGKADVFEVVCDAWELSGDYHEYCFGSRFDKHGNLYVALCLTGSFTSQAKFRGWAGKITSEGKFIPLTSGVRSPGGIGFNAEGDVFYSENQGPWNGACALKPIVEGAFVGHPAGLRWYDDALKLNPKLGPEPAEPRSDSRIMTEAKRIPQLYPPPILFPYGPMGQSASGIDCDLSGGKFGPFEKQLFVGDQTHSTVMRVFLEKVNGRYQGACFPFRKGFGSGNVPVRFAGDGSLIVGGTNRGWGSHGPKPFALERLAWTGKTPFEIKEMRARRDGFELTFTEPVDSLKAADVRSYRMKTFTYIYRAEYGSPEVDQTTPAIRRVELAADHQTVRLYVDGLQEGHIHALKADGVRSVEGRSLLHKEAYYTLNYLPGR